jgi:hypothetical protein
VDSLEETGRVAFKVPASAEPVGTTETELRADAVGAGRESNDVVILEEPAFPDDAEEPWPPVAWLAPFVDAYGADGTTAR